MNWFTYGQCRCWCAEPPAHARATVCYACAGLIAGKPAPTGAALISRLSLYLWERPCVAKGPRRGPKIPEVEASLRHSEANDHSNARVEICSNATSDISGKSTDKASLLPSLENDPDERMQPVLDELRERVQWLAPGLTWHATAFIPSPFRPLSIRIQRCML